MWGTVWSLASRTPTHIRIRCVHAHAMLGVDVQLVTQSHLNGPFAYPTPSLPQRCHATNYLAAADPVGLSASGKNPVFPRSIPTARASLAVACVAPSRRAWSGVK